MYPSGIRSAALARAQAQLSGQRVPTNPMDLTDELQEYMNVLNKKTSTLKLNKMPIPGLSDLSDFSVDTETEESQGSENLQQRVKETESIGQAPLSQSRFLKKKQNVAENPAPTVGSPTIQEEKQPVIQATFSKVRSSMALRKLAEIESKIMNRKLEPQLSDTDSDLRTSDERPFSARSSNDLSTRGSRFMKRKIDSSEKLESGTNQEWREKKDIQTERAMVEKKQAQVTLESEEEEIQKLIRNSMDLSDEDQNWWKLPSPGRSEIQSLINNQTKDLPRTPSPPRGGSPRQILQKTSSLLSLGSLPKTSSRISSRTPSPPSRGSPHRTSRVHSFTRLASRSPSPSARSSVTSTSSPRMKPVGRSWGALSQRSEIKSLDELFSKASMTEDLDSESSNDFKLNILSLDDLQPITQLEAHKAEESKEKIKKTAWVTVPSEEPKPDEQAGKRVSELSKTVTLLKAKQSPSTSENPSTREEETEISEHLNGHSAASMAQEQLSKLDSSRTDGSHSAYSEDFEKSATLSVSENTDYTTSCSAAVESSAGKSRKHRHSSLAYKRAAQPLQSGVRWAEEVRRVAVRETAVQTTDTAFTYPSSNMDGAATFGPHLGTAYIDPVPILGHVVRPASVEALAAYSPAVLALNDMLKQQLMLIQQFVEINRHLHISFLQSLGNETYHYITLEETQEYIKHHRSLPQTTKRVLQEVPEINLHV